MAELAYAVGSNPAVIGMWVRIPPELLKTYTATSYFCKFTGSNPVTSMLAYVVKWLRQLSRKQSLFTNYMSCYAQIALMGRAED